MRVSRYIADHVTRPVSSLRVEDGTEHVTITVHNRGGLAGTLRVLRQDADLYRQRLLPDADVRTREHTETRPSA